MAKRSGKKNGKGRYAVIDIGSNTIRLVVFEVDMKNVTFTQVVNKKIMAGLAGYLRDGALTIRGIHRAQEAIESHLRRLQHYQVEEVFSFATAVIRSARNGKEVIEQFNDRYDLDIEILSGEEEARLGNLAALLALDVSDGVTVDMGGASTEVVAFSDRTPYLLKSLTFGSLSLWIDKVSELFPTADEQRLISEFVRGELLAIPGLEDVRCPTLIGIGGASRAVSKLADHIYHDDTKTRRVETTQMQEMLDRFSTIDKPELLDLVQAVPDRVHTVVPGMLCIHTLARLVHADELLVSPYGIREGYLYARLMGGKR